MHAIEHSLQLLSDHKLAYLNVGQQGGMVASMGAVTIRENGREGLWEGQRHCTRLPIGASVFVLPPRSQRCSTLQDLNTQLASGWCAMQTVWRQHRLGFGPGPVMVACDVLRQEACGSTLHRLTKSVRSSAMHEAEGQPGACPDTTSLTGQALSTIKT